MSAINPEVNLYSVTLQIQGTEDFTKVMIVQTAIDVRKFEWNTRKYGPSHELHVPAQSVCELYFFKQLRTYFPFIK